MSGAALQGLGQDGASRGGQAIGGRERLAPGGDVEDLEYADMDWIIGIDYWGVVHGTKEFLPHLIASGDGHLVSAPVMERVQTGLFAQLVSAARSGVAA